MLTRRTFDFAFFGLARLAARTILALASPRCELFLRAGTRFFALAMAVSWKYADQASMLTLSSGEHQS